MKQNILQGWALVCISMGPMGCSQPSDEARAAQSTESTDPDVTSSGSSSTGRAEGPPARLSMQLLLAGCGVDNYYAMPEDALVADLLGATPQNGLEGLPHLVDGENAASVTCTVVETADNQFTFSASASVGNARRFTLDQGTASRPTQSGPGSGVSAVSFLSPVVIPARNGTHCPVQVVQVLSDGSGLLIDFVCSPPNSTFSPENLDTPNCQASGTVAIDQCRQE